MQCKLFENVCLIDSIQNEQQMLNFYCEFAN